jgi:histidinol phosphatase-like PHP family hydrolase
VIRRLIVIAALSLAGLQLVPAHAQVVVDTHGYTALVGGMHGHSAYSDGYPGPTPATVFEHARGNGNDFFAISDHSDNADVPFTFSEQCVGPAVVECPGGDPNPVNALRKWDATEEYAAAATDSTFSAIRGFEWTSDRFGHINVFFSRNDTNAKVDGGYASMQAFYQWFTRRPELGGGGDGLATFNHPGDKELPGVGAQDPGRNWDDFAYVPEADDRMVGIELYNTQSEYGADYVHALDKGWHLGAVGAEDLGHDPGDDWGGTGYSKTVVLADRNDAPAIRAALLARRFYAVHRPGTRLDFTVDGAVMGSRLARAAGAPLSVQAAVNDPGAVLDLITSGGEVMASGTGALDATVAAPAQAGWYFVRARVPGAERALAYSSPVWVAPQAPPPVGEWLAGDLHVHTCFSHDSYCGPDDDNTGPDEFYTAGLNVDQRFTEAAAKGLDYLAITDHNDVRSQSASGFGGHGVLGVPGYENSLDGHAQMLGATHVFDKGDSSPTAVKAMAGALRAEGGAFQINHPADETEGPFFSGCDGTDRLGWGYGYDVRPDTIEVWNIGHYLQPPAPSGTSNDDSERYWECWLDRGERIAATGGGDSHWASVAAVQGAGNPTTWVFTRERSAAGVLTALREGRTSVSFLPPAMGSARLALEADGDGDGTFESIIGDTVPPGVPMRVRAVGLLGQGLVSIRANGDTILDRALLTPGGVVAFTAPAETGWVRATLLLPDAKEERAPRCGPLDDLTTYCRNHLVQVALTSPIYLADSVSP